MKNLRWERNADVRIGANQGPVGADVRRLYLKRNQFESRYLDSYMRMGTCRVGNRRASRHGDIHQLLGHDDDFLDRFAR